MAEREPIEDMVVDYITGKPVPDVGAERARQLTERCLVEEKGYLKPDVHVNFPIAVEIAGERHESFLDLVVSVDGRTVMVIKCAAGSLESREREVVSAARILADLPLPRAVVSDGRTAVIYDPVTGKKIGEGLDQVPSRAEALAILSRFHPDPVPERKRAKEKIIFRSYDAMNVNVRRSI